MKSQRQITETVELDPEELRQILIKHFGMNQAATLDLDWTDSYGFKGLSLVYTKVVELGLCKYSKLLVEEGIIYAIKEYRSEFGTTIKESKDALETLALKRGLVRIGDSVQYKVKE